jgi:antirestriction protein
MEDETAFDGFTDAYLGEYDSLEAYVEQLIDDLDYEQLLDNAVPESLRPYVRIDTEMLARDMGSDVHVYPRGDGGVWVFDGR